MDERPHRLPGRLCPASFFLKNQKTAVLGVSLSSPKKSWTSSLKTALLCPPPPNPPSPPHPSDPGNLGKKNILNSSIQFWEQLPAVMWLPGAWGSGRGWPGVMVTSGDPAEPLPSPPRAATAARYKNWGAFLSVIRKIFNKIKNSHKHSKRDGDKRRTARHVAGLRVCEFFP